MALRAGKWRKVRREAAYWAVALDSGDADAQLAAFEAWLMRDANHPRAFVEASALWSRTGDPRLRQAYALDPFAGYGADREDRVRGHLGRMRSVFAAFGDGLRPLSSAAVVSAFGLVAGLGLVLTVLDVPTTEYESGVGVAETSILRDGTSVRLNTSTRFTIDFTRDARLVAFERGEAIFDVAPDPERPFIVQSGDRSIAAVGTVFSVKRAANATEVIVSEGRVVVDMTPTEALTSRMVDAVSKARAAADASRSEAGFDAATVASSDTFVQLDAGQSAQFEDKSATRIAALSPTVIAKKLSWRNGVLIFDDQTLDDVVSEISRYTTREIVITDDAIGALRIGGYFPVTDIDTIFALLEDQFPLEVVETTTDSYEIRSESQGG
ncbi:MAG: FecR domain-containing protein [Pseudomonadota bacterium]